MKHLAGQVALATILATALAHADPATSPTPPESDQLRPIAPGPEPPTLENQPLPLPEPGTGQIPSLPETEPSITTGPDLPSEAGASPSDSAPSSPAAQSPETPAAVANVPTSGAIPILGKNVLGPDGKDSVGQIVDILVDLDGRPAAAVIDVGGFLGVGSRKIAVAWQALQFKPADHDAPIILSLSREQVQSAPEYKEKGESASVVLPPKETASPAASIPSAETAPAAETAPPAGAAPSSETAPPSGSASSSGTAPPSRTTPTAETAPPASAAGNTPSDAHE